MHTERTGSVGAPIGATQADEAVEQARTNGSPGKTLLIGSNRRSSSKQACRYRPVVPTDRNDESIRPSLCQLPAEWYGNMKRLTAGS